jgi:hypothetical protein
MSADRGYTVVVGQVEDDGRRLNVKLEISPLLNVHTEIFSKDYKMLCSSEKPQY